MECASQGNRNFKCRESAAYLENEDRIGSGENCRRLSLFCSVSLSRSPFRFVCDPVWLDRLFVNSGRRKETGRSLLSPGKTNDRALSMALFFFFFSEATMPLDKCLNSPHYPNPNPRRLFCDLSVSLVVYKIVGRSLNATLPLHQRILRVYV